MGIRAVESYDGAFELAEGSEQLLKTLLSSHTFCAQVVKQCNLPEGVTAGFAGVLFQPVPWSPTTKRGMPMEFERYLDNPAYNIINVPPNFMFQAKVFKPSRLCAIYHVSGQ
ncbi:hypothetical protein WJX81_004161 [Elliptochloris bilobata]|uniref:Uncharacterized protein n=1 Tax=Elliptochloris bilobata TaxID=381761 RepID=A0AAW1RLR8_9CHLO